jgi:hypothetical protein
MPGKKIFHSSYQFDHNQFKFNYLFSNKIKTSFFRVKVSLLFTQPNISDENEDGKIMMVEMKLVKMNTKIQLSMKLQWHHFKLPLLKFF